MITKVSPSRIRNVCENRKIEEKYLEETVGKLKIWLCDQPHLPQNLDEHFLLLFALGCKQNFENCTKRLDMYFAVRHRMPHFFASRDPLELLTPTKSISCGLMPGYTPDVCKVFAFKFFDNDPTKFYFAEQIAWIFMGADVYLKDDLFSGFYCLIDCTSISFGHYFRLRPSIARDCAFYMENVYPVGMKFFLFLNAPWFGKMFFNKIVRPLLKTKFLKRIHFLDRYSDLHKFLPQDMIPSDMGGTGLDMKEISETWIRDISSKREWLINEGSQKSDEVKRIGKSPLAEQACVVM